MWTQDRISGLQRNRRLLLLRQTTLPVIGIGILLLAGGIYGAWRVHQLQQQGSDILSDNVTSIRAAEELETLVLEMRYRLKRYPGTQDKRHLDEIERLIPEGRKWKDQVGELAKTPREQHLFARLDRGYQRLISEFDALYCDAADESPLQLADHLAGEVIPNRILDNTQKYIEVNEQQLADSDRQNRSTAHRLMFALVMLGTCGGVAGLIAGFVIARRVSRTIVQLSLPIRDTAGKLDKVVGPVSISADPDFDDLEVMLKTVSANVTTVVERLQENEREMLRAEQLAALGQLAAGLAHELRNPLTSLKAILQLAEIPEELSNRDLDVLKQEIVRLEDSVQTFLDFARPPQPQKRLADLRSLIVETVELVNRRAERKSVQLSYGGIDDVLLAMVDTAQIRQVALNLLVNALDAVPVGGMVRIEFFVEQKFEQKFEQRVDWGVLQFVDNGPGLPAEIGNRIFDPFISTKESGIGLGLSICRRILEAHGGTITASDDPQSGAVFVVRLPLAENTTQTREKLHAETIDCG